jgi:hypothetical protein
MIPLEVLEEMITSYTSFFLEDDRNHQATISCSMNDI